MNEYEITLLDGIHNNLSNGFLDWFFIAITWLLEYGIVWIGLIIVLLVIPKTRKIGAAVAIAFLLEIIITQLGIKMLVNRPRPFIVNPTVSLLISPPGDPSFPSGHSGGAFAIASAMFFQGRKQGSRLWIPFTVFAAVIACSRLYLYVHYPSDVLAGIAFGILFGWIGSLIVSAFERWRLRRHDRL